MDLDCLTLFALVFGSRADERKDWIKLKNCCLYIREWTRRERLEKESEKSSDK